MLYAWLEDRTGLKDVWSYATMGNGRESVSMGGLVKKQM